MTEATQPQFSYLMIGLALVMNCRPSCLYSLLAAYKLNKSGTLLLILLRFSYILLIPGGYVILIFRCLMNEVKVEKLPIIAAPVTKYLGLTLVFM